jgi:hypothetical protein
MGFFKNDYIDHHRKLAMNTKIKIHFLAAVVLIATIFKTWAQDGGYLPDLPGFPSGTYAQVAAVGVKIHGYLSATEMHPETGDRKRFIRMTYYGPTDTYARMGICSLYTDPATVARYANPSKKDGRDVIKERRSIKYYRRDGSGGGYSLWYYKAGAVDKLFEYEFQSEDIGMPSPGAVGRPFENLSATDSLEIKFVPKATIFTLKNEESRRPDDVMGAMLLRLEGAAGAASEEASEEVQGIIELGSMVFDPMKAVGLAQNMGQAIVHWDQTMAAIQRQVDDTANTYWESRVGLINPEDAYRKEGAFLFHLASNVTGGWVVKGAGKAKLAGKVDDVAELVAKALPIPKVTDPKLGNLVNDLYKGAKVPNPIGAGSTADAVRNELATGLATNGKFHYQKAQEYINALSNWQKNTPNASQYDQMVAESLKRDLQSALGGN